MMSIPAIQKSELIGGKPQGGQNGPQINNIDFCQTFKGNRNHNLNNQTNTTMKRISILAGLALCLSLYSCGGGESSKEQTNATTEAAPAAAAEETPSYDPHRGEGKWTAENINLQDQLNQEWATSGESIANVKCTSCHKMTDEKLVGPGWKGVTTRRTPEWIMNFITNPDPMLDKDPEAQSMLEICLVRMPNQNLSDAEARNILEYMRKNDGVK